MKYEINKNTLALVPINKNKTIAYEEENYYIINSKVSEIMDDNCKYFGSSYNGRLNGTYSLVGFSYKAPIVLSEEDTVIFFPTSSPRLNDCSWINLNNIKNIINNEDKSTIEFINQEKISFDISYYIMRNQYFKSLSLKNALKNRKIQ